MKLLSLHRRRGKILWQDLKDYDISILHLEFIGTRTIDSKNKQTKHRMLSITIKNICKCFSSLSKMPLLNYPFLHICCSCSNKSLAGLQASYIPTAAIFSPRLRDWSFPSAVASKLVYPPLPLPISFSWELFWPGAKAGGHRPGVGVPIHAYSQWEIGIPSLLIIWAGMEWLGQSQWQWYSHVPSTPTGHFDNIFIGIYAARKNGKENSTVHLKHCFALQSPSAGTEQWRALLATEVHEKVEEYLCKCLSYNKARNGNWKTIRRIKIT